MLKMEDDLKIWKLEYLSNRWSDLFQTEDDLEILKVEYLRNHFWDLPDLPVKYKLRGPNQNQQYLKWKLPSVEDNLKIYKVK